MPLLFIPLITWLGNALFALAMWFISRGGIRFAQFVLTIAALGAAINLLVSKAAELFSSVIPSGFSFVTEFLPDNTTLCVSIVISTEVACTTYKLAIKLIEQKQKVFLA